MYVRQIKVLYRTHTRFKALPLTKIIHRFKKLCLHQKSSKHESNITDLYTLISMHTKDTQPTVQYTHLSSLLTAQLKNTNESEEILKSNQQQAYCAFTNHPVDRRVNNQCKEIGKSQNIQRPEQLQCTGKQDTLWPPQQQHTARSSTHTVSRDK